MGQAKKRGRSPQRSKRRGFSILAGRDRPLRKETRIFFLVSLGNEKEKEACLFSENVSLKGVFLESPEPFPVGRKVKLRFFPDGAEDPIRIEGTVIWNCRKMTSGNVGNHIPGMGVSFDKIQKKDLRKLKQFLNNIPTRGWFLEDFE